jgi:hypothetical protein
MSVQLSSSRRPDNRSEVAAILGKAEHLGVDAEVIRRTLDGRLKVSPDGKVRESSRYLLVGREGAARPDPVQAAWLYAQMVRWGQAPLSDQSLAVARGVFRPDLYDAATAKTASSVGKVADGVGAFAGPAFDPSAITAHLDSFPIRRR